MSRVRTAGVIFAGLLALSGGALTACGMSDGSNDGNDGNNGGSASNYAISFQDINGCAKPKNGFTKGSVQVTNSGAKVKGTVALVVDGKPMKETKDGIKAASRDGKYSSVTFDNVPISAEKGSPAVVTVNGKEAFHATLVYIANPELGGPGCGWSAKLGG